MPAGQSRKGSAVEAVINIVVGYGIAVAANAVLFPLFGWEINAQQNMLFAFAFTVISFVRSYLLRRAFNVAHRWGYFVER